jgi:large subunit ribosomal protein L5
VTHYLKELYQGQIISRLREQYDIANVMQVPRVEKIVVNVGVGDALDDAKALDAAVEDITTITG